MNYREISKIRYKTMQPVFLQLNEKHIPYAVIKGEPLSMMAYGEFGQRKSNDIDILIPRRYIAKAQEILSQHDFEEKNSNRVNQVIALSSTHQALPYKKMIDGVNVEIDLNHDIFWGEYTGKHADIESFLSDVQEMSVYGYKVKTLTSAKAMTQLVLHHYNELNSIYHLSMDYPISTSLFRDVYFLWKNNICGINQQLLEISKNLNIDLFVYYVLFYTSMIFEDTLLTEYTEKFKTQEGMDLLDCYGLTNNERKKWKINFFERLDKKNVFHSIKEDLTKEEFDKLYRAHAIFD